MPPGRATRPRASPRATARAGRARRDRDPAPRSPRTRRAPRPAAARRRRGSRARSAARVGEVVADLVSGHPALRPDRAQECHGQRAGADTRTRGSARREDVGEHEDGAEVLRIDDLRTARHLQHVLGERRPQLLRVCRLPVPDSAHVNNDEAISKEEFDNWAPTLPCRSRTRWTSRRNCFSCRRNCSRT